MDRLNADPEIAFLVPDGPLDPQEAYLTRLRASMGGRSDAAFYTPFNIRDDGYRQRWQAVPTVEDLKDGNHSLWHVPGGPLSLLTYSGLDQVIPDPWEGWTEQRPGADPTTPYFGGGCPAEIGLELWTRHRPYSKQERASLPVLVSYWDDDHDLLVASDFEWIGGHYGSAPPQTRRWWDRLRAWMRRNAVRLSDHRQTFWAFPSAFEKLRAGMAYEARGWDLNESIRAAARQTT